MDVLIGSLGVIVGLFVGVVVDERLFADTPEWTSAITPIVFAFGGWALSRALVRSLAQRRRTHVR
jgi:uncharacterized protein YacL